MSISRQNLTIVIVSFFSDDVIHNCIESIPDDIKIIVVDNSGDKIFKENIEKKYPNIKCILSLENLGMGSGNNLGLKNVDTDYAFILNPDVILKENTLNELIDASKNIEKFGIISPIIDEKKNLNYKPLNNKNINTNETKPFKVKSVDGFAMLLNIKNLIRNQMFKNFIFFDENIFLYLENDDLCKRILDIKEDIYIVPTSKVNHIGGGGVSKKYSFEIELSRNWHWIWSKFYFNKKHRNYLTALVSGFPIFFSAIVKSFLYLILKKHQKKKIYIHRALGYINAAIGKKSWYRPKTKINS